MMTNTLLCVDEDRNILNALKRQLRNEDFRLLTADSTDQGLELLAKESIQVVMVDQLMPGISGVEFLRQVKEKYPRTVRIVLSGFADIATILDAINQGEIFRFLPKPWEDEELRTTVRQCFEHFRLLAKTEILLAQVKRQYLELQVVNQHLEEAMALRTQVLQMTQSIIQHLPIPILGVSEDGVLVMLNSLALKRMSVISPVTLGDSLDEFLPQPIQSHIEEIMATQSLDNALIEWPQGNCWLQTIPFKLAGSLRGCILVIKEGCE